MRDNMEQDPELTDERSGKEGWVKYESRGVGRDRDMEIFEGKERRHNIHSLIFYQ